MTFFNHYFNGTFYKLTEQITAFIVRHERAADRVLGAYRYTYWGEYPLGFAACLGQEECVRLLLAKGANPNLGDTNGNTVLHLLVIHDKKVSGEREGQWEGQGRLKVGRSRSVGAGMVKVGGSRDGQGQWEPGMSRSRSVGAGNVKVSGSCEGQRQL